MVAYNFLSVGSWGLLPVNSETFAVHQILPLDSGNPCMRRTAVSDVPTTGSTYKRDAHGKASVR